MEGGRRLQRLDLCVLPVLACCASYAASPAVVSPAHHAEASALYTQALQLGSEFPRHPCRHPACATDLQQSRAGDPVAAAAINGLLHSGTVLAQVGYDEAALQALDAVLRATPSPGQRSGSAASREHMLAMLQKLGALHRRFLVLAAEASLDHDDDTLGAARWDPALYWLDGVSQWEAQRGPVMRASGCTDPLAAEAVQHLQQLSTDIEVRRVRDCFVGFHGSLLRRDTVHGGMLMLQLPSVPDSTAPLLTTWALGLLPADFQSRGTHWPFELPLAPNVSPEDFTGASVTRRAAQYLQSLQSAVRWPGFAATSREELEAGMLWQSADELRHYERLAAKSDQPCDGKSQVSPLVVDCSRWCITHTRAHTLSRQGGLEEVHSAIVVCLSAY